MPQDALHNYLIVNLCKKLISESWVKNLLNGNRCAVKCAFMDYREATLAYLLTNFDIIKCDFPNTWYLRQPSWGNWDLSRCLSECLEVRLLQILLKVLNFLKQSLLFFLLHFKFFLYFSHFLVLLRSSGRPFQRCTTTKLHPVFIILGPRFSHSAEALTASKWWRWTLSVKDILFLKFQLLNTLS